MKFHSQNNHLRIIPIDFCSWVIGSIFTFDFWLFTYNSNLTSKLTGQIGFKKKLIMSQQTIKNVLFYTPIFKKCTKQRCLSTEKQTGFNVAVCEIVMNLVDRCGGGRCNGFPACGSYLLAPSRLGRFLVEFIQKWRGRYHHTSWGLSCFTWLQMGYSIRL